MNRSNSNLLSILPPMDYASGFVFINDISLSTISLTKAYKIKSTSNTVNIGKSRKLYDNESVKRK